MKEGCGCKKCGCKGSECCSSCACGCQEKCNQEGCGSCCKGGHDDEYMKYFLELADCAWEEVLKEKIKEHILHKHGDRMRELAKIVSESNGERWKCKMEKKKCCHSFKERLSHFFGCGGSCSK